MLNGGLFASLWETGRTLWRQRGLRCPHCASRVLQAKLQTVVTPRGYVLRCWQCGGEYVEHEWTRLRQVWPL